MNLKEWAIANGVHPVTAYRWFREGKLPVPATRIGGLILIDQPASIAPAGASIAPAGATVVYARVSSADQTRDLDRQVARVTTWSTGRNLPVDRVVTEVGCARDGSHKKLLALLADPEVATIVVERRDRFATFGAEYVDAVLSASGRRLLVVDPSEVDDDLAGDLNAILTSLCTRLYGPSTAASRAARGLAAIEQDTP